MSTVTESGSGAEAPNETGGRPRSLSGEAPRGGLVGVLARVAFLRLARMYLISRRVPAAVGVLIGLAGVLQLSLAENWIHGTSPAAQQLPLGLETAAAAIVAATTVNPFGDSERTAVRWLPWLRPTVALALTLAAAGLFAAGAISRSVPGGEVAAARNICGIAGIGLLCAPFVGGNLAWVGPLAYFPLAEYALTVNWFTPWTWPARPPHDIGAALCAGLVFVIGAVAISVRGVRDRVAE
jgi:hypothetical protein